MRYWARAVSWYDTIWDSTDPPSSRMFSNMVPASDDSGRAPLPSDTTYKVLWDVPDSDSNTASTVPWALMNAGT